MKAKFSVLAFSTFLFATAWTAPGYEYNKPAATDHSTTIVKPAGELSFFRLHRQGKGVTASWGLTSEAGVIGFQVQKTYEDPADPYAIWENVSWVPSTGSRSYKCTDGNVFPGNISYQVVVQKADGTTIASGISTARIVGH
jgi:hypothetical protein